MAVHSGLLRLETQGEGHFVDITEGVQRVVSAAEVEVGIAVAFAVGSTAAITTLEYEPGAVQDMRKVLDELIPARAEYEHNRLNHDSNAHAHMRAALIGPSETVPVVQGRLGLGTWQQVVFIELDDRPRSRTVTVQVIT